MHVVQYLLVQARDTQGALAAAESSKAQAEWSDWSVIGGRWDGEFSQRFPDIGSSLEDPNVLPVLQFPQEVGILAREIAKRQNQAFLESRDALVGNEVAASDVNGHIFGIPIADTAGTAKRRSAENRKTAREWQDILQSITLEQASQPFSMATFYARRVIALVDDLWTSDSAYFDTLGHSTRTRNLLALAANPPRPGNDMNAFLPFLVTVDFHY